MADDPLSQAVQFYVQKGLTPQQARGVASWMQGVESGLNPRAFNPAGGGEGALGVAQWRGPRQAELLRQPDPFSLQGQLDFSWKELTGPEHKALDAIKG